MKKSKELKLEQELGLFNGLWKGGYYEGDPLNPFSKSSYYDQGLGGYMSTLYVTYLMCIKPYINKDTVSLEIGPGRGAWTKALLSSKEIHVLDALPEKHNDFFKYLNHPKNVTYHQVKDFRCEMLPENYFNYMFSYGALCHVSLDGIKEYATNLYSKLKSGSNCFWMVADYDKYNKAIQQYGNIDTLLITKKGNILSSLAKNLRQMQVKYQTKLRIKPNDTDYLPEAGRFYNGGINTTCNLLEGVGYEIVSRDVETCLRDPIIHFRKP